jgi:hypothetical protein
MLLAVAMVLLVMAALWIFERDCLALDPLNPQQKEVGWNKPRMI